MTKVEAKEAAEWVVAGGLVLWVFGTLAALVVAASVWKAVTHPAVLAVIVAAITVYIVLGPK